MELILFGGAIKLYNPWGVNYFNAGCNPANKKTWTSSFFGMYPPDGGSWQKDFVVESDQSDWFYRFKQINIK